MVFTSGKCSGFWRTFVTSLFIYAGVDEISPTEALAYGAGVYASINAAIRGFALILTGEDTLSGFGRTLFRTALAASPHVLEAAGGDYLRGIFDTAVKYGKGAVVGAFGVYVMHELGYFRRGGKSDDDDDDGPDDDPDIVPPTSTHGVGLENRMRGYQHIGPGMSDN